jgi:formamidopyrimidine-DNA glycosylase
MPELPSVTVYVEHLQRLINGDVLEKVLVASPFVLRSYAPPLEAVHGKRVRDVRRLGKRVVIELDDELFLIIHLMVAGRFRWSDREPGSPPVGPPRKVGLAAFQFSRGTLVLTEQGSKRRASLHVVAGSTAVQEFDRGGLEVATASAEEFREAVQRENHTLKRTLSDPRFLSGIGNAYSDEILLRARLSPLQHSQKLSAEQVATLRTATVETLAAWVARLRAESGSSFPKKVTAFHPAMAAHGKFGEPCPQCGTPIQRIRYADNESNYCPSCQTGGKLLADRSLSRLLKGDWPRSVDELDELRRPRADGGEGNGPAGSATADAN